MKNYFLFICYSVFYVLLFELLKFICDFDKLLYNSLAENLTSEQIDSYFNLQSKWLFLSFIILPLIFYIKVWLITLVIYLRVFFLSKNDVQIYTIWHGVLKAEFIFLIVPIFKIVWFYFFQTTFTLEDLQYFYPLSALNIVGYKGLDVWFIYPLQILNLFELAYWIILAYYIGKIASPTTNREENKYPIDFGLKIVASSYGSALLLWVVVVMFFTLNYS